MLGGLEAYSLATPTKPLLSEGTPPPLPAWDSISTIPQYVANVAGILSNNNTTVMQDTIFISIEGPCFSELSGLIMFPGDASYHSCGLYYRGLHVTQSIISANVMI